MNFLKSSSGDMKDFNKFMKKVNDLDSIVNGMISGDEATQAEALARADKALKKADPNKNIGFDRTVINKKAFEDDDDEPPSPLNFTAPQTDQNAFLQALEADAKQRSEQRKKRHAKAEVMKEKGNVLFKEGKYKQALDCYGDAIHTAKDMPALYTNRAATFMKLHDYEQAIADCDFAMRVDEKWVKSYFFKGRALQKLLKFDEAAEAFKLMKVHDENKEKTVEVLLKELEHDRKVTIREEQAKEMLLKKSSSSGNENVEAQQIDVVIKNLRERINQKKGSIMNVEDCCFYTVGVRLLQSLCVDEKSRTLFRIEQGFELVLDEILTKEINLKCSTIDRGTKEQSQLVISIVCLLREVCRDMDENLVFLLTRPQLPQMLLDLLTSCSNKVVCNELVGLLHTSSITQDGRNILYKHLDICSISKSLLEKTKKFPTAISTFHNFTIDQKFLRILAGYDDKTECIKRLTPVLKHYGESKVDNEKVLKILFNCVLNLCENKNLAAALSKDEHFNKIFQDYTVSTFSASNNLLKFQLQICYLMFKQGARFDTKIAECLMNNVKTFGDTPTHIEILKLLSAIVETREDLMNILQDDKDLLKELYRLVKKNTDPALRMFGLKIICLVSKNHAKKLSFLQHFDKKYKTLREILAREPNSASAVDQGHAALLLGNMAQVDDVVHSLACNDDVCGDVIRRLLVLCRDLPDKTSRVNCVISLAKLAKSHPRFLHHLRLNDGINILSKQDPSEL